MNEEERARRNGLQALATVERVLTEIGWEPQRTEIEEVLMVDFEVDDIPISDAQFEVRVDYERFVCRFNFKDRVAPARENDALQFLAYTNYDLVIGNFELDLQTGSIRVKSSIDFSGAVLDGRLIRNAIRSGMDVVEHYADLLVEVISGKKDANEAIREAEAELGAEDTDR